MVADGEVMADKQTRDVLLVFKEPAENRIVWPCEIEVPLSGGGFQTQVLKARFQVLADERMEFFYPTQNAMLALIANATADMLKAAQGGGEIAPPPAPPGRRGDDGLLDEALLGLVDVPGAGERSEAEVAKALRETPYVKDGLVRGYQQMIGRRLAKN
jgi:hypothetical protein